MAIFFFFVAFFFLFASEIGVYLLPPVANGIDCKRILAPLVSVNDLAEVNLATFQDHVNDSAVDLMVKHLYDAVMPFKALQKGQLVVNAWLLQSKALEK